MDFPAVAGGSMGGSDICTLCGLFLLWPGVLFLSFSAMARASLPLAMAALVMAGVPFALLVAMVLSYEPHPDPDIISEQEDGRSLVWQHVWMVVIAGAAVMWAVVAKRLRPRGGVVASAVRTLEPDRPGAKAEKGGNGPH